MPPEQTLLQIDRFLSNEHTHEAIHTIFSRSLHLSLTDHRGLAPRIETSASLDHYGTSERLVWLSLPQFKHSLLMSGGL